MPDLVHVTYKQTGKSKKTNEYGMREMQARAYDARTAQYLLIKAPPASGKSRALMFIGLDKLRNQDIKKVLSTKMRTFSEFEHLRSIPLKRHYLGHCSLHKNSNM